LSIIYTESLNMRITKEEYDKIITLLSEKKKITEISKLTGLSRTTINVWKNGKEFEPLVSNFRDILNKMSKEELQKLINESCSISDVLDKFKQAKSSSFYRNILKEFITKYNLDLSKMAENKKVMPKNTVLQFCVNSKTERASLKASLLRRGIFINQCSECGMKDFYNNKPVSMELDHINGINNDNRIENLRMLCPVCHSQQPTHRGRNVKIKPIKKSVKDYCACGNLKYHTSNLCYVCITKNRPKKFTATKEELELLVKEKPMTEIGKMFGVSDNAVKKRCQKLGIELKPMRGHWMKKKYGKE
jgi:Zn finger protein HypA/HybF involved in hydrogenase expression